MIPLLAAILLAGAAGAGPVLVSDACSQDTTAESGSTRCAVEKIDRRMKSQEVPAELKVEAEGKLYSVPEGVEYNTPTCQPSAENWWKEFVRKVKGLVDRDSDKAKKASSDPPAEGETLKRNSSCGSDGDGCDGKTASLGKNVSSVGEHSCQICFEQDHSTVMLPCGHGGLCWDCGLQIYALTEECPMCRTKVELVDGEKRRYEGGEEFVSAVCA